MRILVINTGSSSLKYTLFHGEEEIASGLVEKIGAAQSWYTRSVRHDKHAPQSVAVADHSAAIALMKEALLKDGVIQSVSEIDAVGHRVVHGGPQYSDAALVDRRVRHNRIALELAPLHRVNYTGIEAAVKMLPKTPQVAVFDTAFFHTIPPKAYTYALPYHYLAKYKIRKYGFHGTSHKYVSRRAAQLLGRSRAGRLITLHLGNGSSISAVRQGECVDTSMGLTPLAGVVMGTRCGDIDPAIVPYLMEREQMDTHAVDQLMNQQSGLLGLSGVSNDLREVIAAAKKKNPRAQLALEVFIYSIQKYIGTYFGVLSGADALIFTAGIGEKSPLIRAAICQGLSGLGIMLDARKNRAVIGREAAIHAAGSPVKVWVIPTREEYMIARETERIVNTRCR